jgi:mannose-6-phosphate isomerase
MTVTKLTTRRIEKPWGRTKLWPGFADVPAGGAPVGEIWFEDPRGGVPELLVKYLFTSERLSIQVHPDDAAAQACGYPRGKDEAWLILAAEPEATIALGLREVISRDALRAAALDGSITAKMFWKPVHPGEAIYSPAGTVHAIGAGLTLIEVQQNIDLTYRLYDYGRPRELQLDDGIAVSDPVPFVAPHVAYDASPGRTILADGPAFVFEQWTLPVSGTLASDGRALLLIPVNGEGTLDHQPLLPGDVWAVDGSAELTLAPDSQLLLAYPGQGVIAGLR